MSALLFWLVTVGVVAMTTAAPVANMENGISLPAQAASDEGGPNRVVAKRAEEMIYFGNRQNPPRETIKKKWNDDSLQYGNYPEPPLGEVDEGGSVVAHQQKPVDEALKARAEAVKGPSESERMEEATKIAMDEAMKGGESEGGVEKEGGASGSNDMEAGGMGEGGDSASISNDIDENIVNAVDEDNRLTLAGVDQTPAATENEGGVEEMGEAAVDSTELDLPEATGSDSNSVGESGAMTNDDGGTEDDEEEEDVENIGDVTPSNQGASDNGDGATTKEEDDEEVKEFLDELRHESEGDDHTAAPKYTGEGPTDFPVYSGRPFYMWPNGKPAPPPTGRLANYLRYTAPYVPLGRDSYRRRRRRSGHVRRFKRGLPSDWLPAYSGLDIPMTSEELKDSILSEPEESYGYEPVDDELSRYIYGNLLNKIANSYRGEGMDADVEEEVPYEEILPYDIGSELPESMNDDDEPEELLYDPDYLRDSPYDDVIPSYGYRKRSGGLDMYYPDSRRKRYFYPAYDEPETHWGAFVPEKRNYDDAIQRLQRLAMVLSDTPRPYYENLLREYKKK